MTAVLALCVTGLGVGVLLLLWSDAQLFKRNRPDPLARRRVVVHTKDDSSIRGVLTASHPDCYVIGHPEYLNEAAPQQLQGEVLVLRSNVSWIQILGGE